MKLTTDNSQVGIIQVFECTKLKGKLIAVITGHFKSGKVNQQSLDAMRAEVTKYSKEILKKEVRSIEEFTLQQLDEFRTYFKGKVDKDKDTWKKPFDIVKKNYGAILLGTKMAQLANADIPVIFAGDFNNAPRTLCGSYDKIFGAFRNKLTAKDHLANAYQKFDMLLGITTYKQRIGGDQDKLEDKISGHPEDYILHTKGLHVESVLGLVDTEKTDKELCEDGLVNYRYPSDHFAVGGIISFPVDIASRVTKFQAFQNGEKKDVRKKVLGKKTTLADLYMKGLIEVGSEVVSCNGKGSVRKAHELGIVKEMLDKPKNPKFAEAADYSKAKQYITKAEESAAKMSNENAGYTKPVEVEWTGHDFTGKSVGSKKSTTNWSKGSTQVKTVHLQKRRRRMAQREFSNRRDSPVMVRLLQQIIAAQEKKDD